MRIDLNHYDPFISFIFDPGIGCLEFVCWQASINRANMIQKSSTFPRTIGGWYTKLDHLKFDVSRLCGITGYICLNPVMSDCLSRSANAVSIIGKGKGTKEENIVVFRHLLIDIDCQRPAEDMSATDEELNRTIAIRDAILSDHPEIADSSIWGTTGNGSYIIVKIEDYPILKGKKLAQSFLRGLAEKYGKKARGDKAYIDTNTYSPVFHAGIPGTFKCKGSHTEERPHRLITVDGVGYTP